MAEEKTRKKKRKKKEPELAPGTPSDFDIDAIASQIQDIDETPMFLKILVYGEQGSGKTTFAATAPGPVLFVDCNEKGTDSIRGLGHKVFPAKTWDDLEGIYWYLATGKHKFKSVVLDTVTQAMDLGMKKVLELDGHEGLPIRKHWGQLTTMAKNRFIDFRNLPMNVLFLAQLKNVSEEDMDDAEPYARIPALSPSVRASLGAAVSVIGYQHIKEVMTEKKGKTKVGYSYRMRIGPSSEVLTKVRIPKGLSYPTILKDPSFSQIWDILPKGGNVDGEETGEEE